jgi:hypothetical protein
MSFEIIEAEKERLRLLIKDRNIAFNVSSTFNSTLISRANDLIAMTSLLLRKINRERLHTRILLLIIYVATAATVIIVNGIYQ